VSYENPFLKSIKNESPTNLVHEAYNGFSFPPAASWFGGALAWESLVKSTKRAMKAIMGNVVTVDEVFLTVVAEILGHL
jgi:hypothetical protein